MFIVVSCGSKYKINNVDQKNAFYFWKSNWDLETKSIDLLDSLDVKVYYLKFFDVDWDSKNKEVIPIGRDYYHFASSIPLDRIEVIPTVYISNDVLKNLNTDQLNGLAHNIYIKTRVIFSSFYSTSDAATSGPKQSGYGEGPYKMTYQDLTWPERDTSKNAHEAFKDLKEIQIDCDWTESTRDKYFEFLRAIKKEFKDKMISCTIRMYPYKYPTKAGVPPVDKGMLMIYNVGDVTKAESGNSIFDKKEVTKYLNGKEKYPLILDYAFPIFEWLSVYRNNKLIKILPTDAIYFWATDKRFTVYEKDNTVIKYKVNEEVEVYNMNFTLEKEDIIKYETINYDEVAEIAAKISSMNTNPKPNITLFQFDYENVHKNKNKISKIYSNF